MIISSWF